MHRLMFWTTNGRIPSITRGGMDVAGPKRIIRGISFKNGFVVDHNESRLFWLHRSDTIETSDFDWRNRRTIRPIRNKLISVAVMDDLLYWTDNETIQSCNKRTETDLKTVKKYGLPNFLVWEMALIHDGAQPKDRTNHCAGSLCSHLCLLTENYFKCICPPEMELSPDGLTCQCKLPERPVREIKFDPVDVLILSVQQLVAVTSYGQGRQSEIANFAGQCCGQMRSELDVHKWCLYSNQHGM